MNTLSDPIVVELLERLHQEADARMPELRKVVATMGESDLEPWTDRLRNFYLPVSREQG